MDRRIDMPWVGAKHHGEWDQNTIGRGFDLLYVEWSKYLGIPCIGGSIYQWWGNQYTMVRRIEIPLVGGSIYHG